MFRFTKKPSSGSYSQCLAKITRLVQCWCRRQWYGGCGVCCALCKRIRLHSAQHTRHSCHTTDNVCTTSISTL